MSLLDELEVEEVIDDDYYDPRPLRGEGRDIRLDRSKNDKDIVLSCKARIPKKYYENLSYYNRLLKDLNGKCVDTWEIYTPVSKFIVSDDFNPNRLIQRVFNLFNESENLDLKLRLIDTDENLLFDNVFKGSDNLPPLFCKLQEKISNDTSKVSIDNSVWDLIDDILAEGDFHYTHFRPYQEVFCGEVFCGLLLTERDITTWLSFLKSSIPVSLVDEEKMPDDMQVPVEFPDKKPIEDVDKKNDEPITKSIDGNYRYMEWLGFYSSKGTEREIKLCPKRIKETADKLKIPFDYLVAIVYIHELGHAALDETIDLDEEANKDEEIKIKFNNNVAKIDTNKDKFNFVMEESLANMIMLQYINWYTECCNDKLKDGDVLYETAELLVKKQSPAYAFGQYQFDADVDWLSWRKYKESIKNKQKPKAIIGDKQKSEWYDLFGNIMNPNIYRQSFNKLFN